MSRDPQQELLRVRHAIDELKLQEEELNAELGRSATDLHDARILEDYLHQILYRNVGFEEFDPARASLLPQKVYICQSKRYVLLGFFTQRESNRFFDFVTKTAHNFEMAGRVDCQREFGHR